MFFFLLVLLEDNHLSEGMTDIFEPQEYQRNIYFEYIAMIAY